MFKSNHIEIKGGNQDNNLGSPLHINKTSIELTSEELELILITIKNSLFKGEYVELLYNLTLKLQQEYIHCKTKQDK